MQVPMAMHGEHRSRLVAALRKRSEIGADAAVLLQGGAELPVYDTDTAFPFRQESNFQYLFGVKEPDCYAALRVSDGHAILFIPKLPAEYQAWLGPIKPPAWFESAYAVDRVAFTDEIEEVLQGLGVKELVFLGADANRDSGKKLPQPSFKGKELFKTSAEADQALWDEINECRVIKSPEELKLMQYVNDVSTTAHIEAMKAIQAGQREYIAEAVFKYQSALRGCFRVGYVCICGSGRRNAVLHYGHAAEPNSELVDANSLRLLDMGAEYHCYTADVTCTFPVAGTFNDHQRAVYEAVWEAVLAVETRIKPGVVYKDMHKLAQRILLEKMTEAGLFVGNVDEMVACGLISHFMPHGLGHCLGLDVHDVGGYEPGQSRKDDSSIEENLRCGRSLKENMVITVEPGFYFIDYLIEEALADPVKSSFIVKPRLKELWDAVGGVRIEDDVVITATGCRVLTSTPRTVEEIEAVLAGTPWTVGGANCREYTAA